MLRAIMIGLMTVIAGALCAQASQWDVKSGFTGRQGHGSVVFNGRMWVIGGQAYNIYKNDVWSSANGQDWDMEVASAPFAARTEHQTLVFNNKIWLIGGRNNSNFLGDIWSSQDGVNWNLEAASAPFGLRAQHAATVFNGEIFLMGGTDSWYYLNGGYSDVWSSSDGVNWSQHANAPWSGRVDLSAIEYAGQLMVVGGNEGVYFTNDVWSYDGTTWTQLTGTAWPGMWGPRNSAGLAILGGTLFAVGAEHGWGPLGPHRGTGEVYSTVDGANWTLVTGGSGWDPRTGHTALEFNGNLWVIAGIANGWNGGMFNSCRIGEEVCDVWSSPDGMIWTKHTSDGGFEGWHGRNGHACTELNGKLWLVGGMRPLPGSSPHYGKLCDVWSSPDGQTWTEETATAAWSARSGLGCVAFNNQLWVMGGDTGTPVADVWSSSDGITWAQVSTSNLWPARSKHGCVVFQGKIWVIGGQNGSLLRDVWSSPDGINWTQETAQAAWSARSDQAVAVHNNRLWLIGGWDGTTFMNDVWSSADGINWTLETNTPDFNKRYGHAVASAGGRLWMAAGKGHQPGLAVYGPDYFAGASFTTTTGTPSGEQSFTVCATNMSTPLVITPPAGFEIATLGGNYQASPLSLPHTAGALAATPVRYRYNPAQGTAHSGQVHIKCGQVERTIAVSGTVSAGAPEIRISGCLAPFNGSGTMPTTEQTYTVQASNLSADLMITGTTSFEVALVGGSFGSALTLVPVAGSVASTTIRVRYNVQNNWTTGAIVHTSTGAAEQRIAGSSNNVTMYAWQVETNDLWSSADGVTWVQEQACPFNARIGHTLTSFNGSVWMLGGGHFATSGVTYNHLIAFPAEAWELPMPSIQLAAAATNVPENAGSATLTVELNRAYAFDVDVAYATSNGTAAAGQDYTQATGTVSIVAGQTSASFSITINDDQLDEMDETVLIDLSAGTANVGAQSTAMLHILDDDGAPTVRFTAATAQVGENAGTLTLDIELSNVSGLDVIVDFVAADVTAADGYDYSAASGQVMIAAGSTSASITVAILQDAIDENPEDFLLSLVNPQNAGIGANADITVTIMDDDAAPEIVLAATALTVNEGDGAVMIQLSLTNPSAMTVTLDYSANSGTALAGQDFAAGSGTVSFAPGVTTQSISVALLNDAENDPDESFTVTLSKPVNGTLTGPSIVTVTILRDQNDIFQVDGGGGSGGEGGGCAAQAGSTGLAILGLLLAGLFTLRLRSRRE